MKNWSRPMLNRQGQEPERFRLDEYGREGQQQFRTRQFDSVIAFSKSCRSTSRLITLPARSNATDDNTEGIARSRLSRSLHRVPHDDLVLQSKGDDMRRLLLTILPARKEIGLKTHSLRQGRMMPQQHNI